MGSADGSWRLWDVRQPEPVLHQPQAHDSAVRSVTVLGMRLITASLDGWSKVWDFRTGSMQEMRHVDAVYMLGLKPPQHSVSEVKQQRQQMLRCSPTCGFGECG